MIQVDARPPLFDEIAAVFPEAANPGVIFSWGNRVYVPGGGRLPGPILAHEKVHGQRQGKNVEDWWRRYLADVPFRLDEELAGHRAEYREMVREMGTRHACASLIHVARKLASPLYGGMVTVEEARRLVSKPGRA